MIFLLNALAVFGVAWKKICWQDRNQEGCEATLVKKKKQQEVEK